MKNVKHKLLAIIDNRFYICKVYIGIFFTAENKNENSLTTIVPQ